MNKKIGFAIWGITFAFYVFLMLIIPDNYTSDIVITIVFTGIAYVSQLLLWLYLFNSETTSDELFYKSPIILVSIAYLIFQFVVAMIKVYTGWTEAFKTTLIINISGLFIVWFLIILLIGVNAHIKNVDSRQEDHRTILHK